MNRPVGELNGHARHVATMRPIEQRVVHASRRRTPVEVIEPIKKHLHHKAELSMQPSTCDGAVNPGAKQNRETEQGIRAEDDKIALDGLLASVLVVEDPPRTTTFGLDRVDLGTSHQLD